MTEHPYCMPGEHCEFMATRTIQVPQRRALDFAAITDHAEQFGEANICVPPSPITSIRKKEYYA